MTHRLWPTRVSGGVDTQSSCGRLHRYRHRTRRAGLRPNSSRVGRKRRPELSSVESGKLSTGKSGFSLIELLTVLAIVAVLATLLASSIGATRARSRQVACQNQLRHVALAVAIYEDDTGRRPRALSRLTARPSWLSNPRGLLCPGDPAIPDLESTSRTDKAQQLAWGNIASPTQEPKSDRPSQPEEGTWEAEIRVTTETVPFSYLHPLAWRRDAWQRLGSSGNQGGIAACQLHGVRVPNPGERLYLAYEGSTLRVQRDGAVVLRKIFRAPAEKPLIPGSRPPAPPTSPPPSSGITVAHRGNDYPWEFYMDAPPLM